MVSHLSSTTGEKFSIKERRALFLGNLREAAPELSHPSVRQVVLLRHILATLLLVLHQIPCPFVPC